MQIDRIFAAITIAAAIGAGVSMLLPDNALAVPAPTPLAVSTTPLPLNRDDPAQTDIDELKFRGAVQIRSSDPLFGGISALRAGPPASSGTAMLAVTDTGNWLAFDTVESDGRLTGIANALLTPILQPDGKPVAVKADGDAEALEWNPASGAATIVYEQDHRLAHFTGISRQTLAALAALPTRIERLTQMTGWPLNNGGEAMAQLPDGTRLILAETGRRPDGARTALLTRNGKTIEIGIEGVPDHSPTDAVALDATRILILHRRFDMMGVGAALSLVDLAPAFGANPPATLPARIIARWQPPLTLDNMEGLAIRRDGDRVFLYVISDDNLNSIQRTVLMKFELSASAIAPSP